MTASSEHLLDLEERKLQHWAVPARIDPKAPPWAGNDLVYRESSLSYVASSSSSSSPISTSASQENSSISNSYLTFRAEKSSRTSDLSRAQCSPFPASSSVPLLRAP